MISDELVELARFQFAFTALYHFLFVPLTLGLSFLLAIMESVYVMTGKQIYQDMTKFWAKLFAINFALGIATGLTMEFQFGTNWSYFSHFVGDIFGAPLAIEALMSFFLESTFFGLFFFGWEKLGPRSHLAVTWLMALGTNLSAMWILVANGWMQNPVGSEFNFETMRMEVTSFSDVILNPAAQVKFVHTVAAGYTTGAMLVLGVSAYYLLRGRDMAFSQRSFAAAAGFGLAAAISVIVLGDESGYTDGQVQRVKLAAIEAEWETQEPPASFTLIGIPDQEKMETQDAVKIPWVLGLIATRSFDEPVVGLKTFIALNRKRIRDGMTAYMLLQKLKRGQDDSATRELFEKYKEHLGYGLLLKRYTAEVVDATDAQIEKAAHDTIPNVKWLFFSFRIMVACGILILFVFVTAFIACASRRVLQYRGLLWTAVFSIPLPWIACEMGWFVAEYGRQPWSIAERLPTFLSVSTRSVGELYFSLFSFAAFYSFFLVIEVYLMLKYIRLGPSSLHTGRYYFEKSNPQVAV